MEEAKFPKHDSPERQEARNNYIKEWKSLEKLLASNTKVPELKKSIENLDRYFSQMRYIPGQTPPTGSAAKAYSTVTVYEDPYKK